MLAQVDGVKEFVFIDPIDSLAIYKDHAPGVYGSPLDLTAVDLRRYPEVTEGAEGSSTSGARVGSGGL